MLSYIISLNLHFSEILFGFIVSPPGWYFIYYEFGVDSNFQCNI